jgi:hypothetical protein
MSGGRGTVERLRYHLSGQPEREKLLERVLAMGRPYRDMRPLPPRGGPDQGKHIEAVHIPTGVAFGAVDFVSSATDESAPTRKISKKSKDDVERALTSQRLISPMGFRYPDAPQQTAFLS